MQAPFMAFVLLAVAVIVFRVVGTVANDLHTRRELLGYTRGSDTAVVAARTPLDILRGILAALPQLLTGLCAGMLVAALGWWAYGAGFLELPWLFDTETGIFANVAQQPGGVTHAVHSGVLAVAMVVALLATWFGTHSALTRYGSRIALGAIAPRRILGQTAGVSAGEPTSKQQLAVGTVLLVLFAIFTTIWLIITLRNGTFDPINWWPLNAPPRI
jgi:hypothetical protein